MLGQKQAKGRTNPRWRMGTVAAKTLRLRADRSKRGTCRKLPVQNDASAQATVQPLYEIITP